VAAFVSPTVLDHTDRGKAFWDAGLAALGLKQEVCQAMVKVADEIVEMFAQTRKKPPGDAALPPPGVEQTPSGSLPSTKPYTLADAGRMWTITAREGDPAAQRELALFYLSNPELVERTTQPLSKPREVFKQAVMEKYGGGSTRAGAGTRHYYPSDRRAGSTASSGSGISASSSLPVEGTALKDGDVRDPALMCVAFHWMEAAEQGGDELAASFLRQNEFRRMEEI